MLRDISASEFSNQQTTRFPAPEIELLDQYATVGFKVAVSGNSLVKVENNCINPTSAKSTYLCESNIKALKYQYDRSQLQFLTITFQPDSKLSDQGAKDRLHRLTTNIFNRREIGWIRVLERNRSGVIHFHILLALPWDARNEIKDPRRINTKSRQRVIEKHFSGRLLALSQELGVKLPKYDVGLWNMTPVKCLDAVATYMCKALRSPMNQYKKGERRWSCSKFLRCAKGAIAWVSGRARAFRQAVEYFAFGMGIDDLESFQKEFGTKWFYFNQVILFRFCKQIISGDISEILAHIRDRVFHDTQQHGAFYRPHPRRKWRSALPAQPEKEGGCALG